MRQLLSLIFFLSILWPVKGQDTPPNIVAVNLGYYGETVTHPGVNLGIEFYPHQTGRHQMILAGNTGEYSHQTRSRKNALCAYTSCRKE